MMFKGTKDLGPEEFSRIIQANGGTLNAFTTTDNTSYYENLPADKLELAVRLEADRLEMDLGLVSPIQVDLVVGESQLARHINDRPHDVPPERAVHRCARLFSRVPGEVCPLQRNRSHVHQGGPRTSPGWSKVRPPKLACAPTT